MPWRADVWLRLGRAGQRIGWDGARDALERAASAPEERDAARLALLDLSDLDLAAGDPARAQRWLDRIPAPLTTVPDRDVALRRAECALAYGDLDGARGRRGDPRRAHRDRGGAPPSCSPGPRWPRRAPRRAPRRRAPPRPCRPPWWGGALDLGLRALVLDVPGAAELCAALVAASRDVLVVDRVRRVVRAAGALDEPTWAAAFAFAEGRRDDARQALARGLSAGDRAAAAALLRMAVETRDLGALDALARAQGQRPRRAARRGGAPASPDLVRVRDAAAMAAAGQGSGALDALDAVTGEGAAWADDMRRAIAQAWVAPAPTAPRRGPRRAAGRVERRAARAPRARPSSSTGSTCSPAIEALAVERSGRSARPWWASSTRARARS